MIYKLEFDGTFLSLSLSYLFSALFFFSFCRGRDQHLHRRVSKSSKTRKKIRILLRIVNASLFQSVPAMVFDVEEARV
jgi:hypothetical protein